MSGEEIENNINDIYQLIHSSTIENFQKWKIIGKDIWPNKFNFKSYDEEVKYLKTWSHKRLQWLDSRWQVNN